MPPAEAAVAAGARPLDGLRLLVADDSPSTREILKRMLERAGARVQAVSDGSEVQERLRAGGEAFDGVVLDLVMARVGGMDAARAVLELMAASGRRMAIVFMSVGFDEKAQSEVARLGAHPEAIGKPLLEREVLRVVAAALGRSPDVAPAAPAARAPLPSFPGCDLAGALERCGGDRDLLLLLQSHLVGDIQRRSAVFNRSIRSLLYPIALGDLHRMRGDLLNLGFIDIALRIGDIEVQTAELAERSARPPDKTVPSAIIRGGEHLIARMQEAVDRLSVAVAALRQLPALAVVASKGAGDAGIGEEKFAALVAQAASSELATLRGLDLDARLLPARYPEGVDAEFRSRLRRLDFPGALRLLDPADRAAPVAAGTSGFRILLVDDMPSAVLLLHGMIQHIGQVRFALSGEQALEIATAWAPDLVISDVHLGGMSGIELCRRFKALPQGAEAVVLLVSADGDIGVEVEGLTAGATDFLSKPINPARVVGRINTHLSALRRQSAFAVAVAREASTSLLGFITCTFAGGIIDASPRVAREVGVEGTWKGCSVHEAFAAGSAPQVLKALGEIARTGRTEAFDALLLGPREAVPVRIAGWSAPGSAGRIAWLSIEDRRDRLAGERRRFEEELSRSIGTLAGGMAHEFNNLLTVAIGNVDLAAEASGADAGQRDCLEKASRALLRAARISRRLGDFGLRSGNDEKKRPLVQDLDTLLDQLWPLLTQGVPAGVVILRERSSEPAEVRIDARGLRTALTNLLLNAYASMPGGGQVVVRTRLAEQGANGERVAVIDVTDTGTGMGPEILQRAFEPFFTTASPAHAGLGLTEVRGFAHRHGGTVELDSAPGKGTRVQLSFGLAKSPN